MTIVVADRRQLEKLTADIKKLGKVREVYRVSN